MKKNYSLIGEWVKRNGVSFLVSDGVCMDIKAEPNTEEVDFGDLYGMFYSVPNNLIFEATWFF